MLSTFFRRTHMYVALFLIPWMMLYALSTMSMNHKAFFEQDSGEKGPKLDTVSEETFHGEFAPGATPKQMAIQILSGLGLDGAHTIRNAGGRLVINRNDIVHPRRITYTPDTNQIRIEKEVFHTTGFLERFHRRRGFQAGYFADNVWGVIVDGVILAMIFWVISGIWMWWEMSVTRRWGALALLGGIGLFALFLFSI